MMIFYMNNIFERIILLKGYYQDNFFVEVFHMGISVNEHVFKSRKRLKHFYTYRNRNTEKCMYNNLLNTMILVKYGVIRRSES